MMKKMPIEPAHLQSALEAAIQLWKEQDKRHWIAITGNSMLPLLRDGDHVLVAHDDAHIQVGDVIVFWQSKQLIVHRIIHIERMPTQLGFLTKGDNAVFCDPLVRADQVIGRVLAVRRDQQEISLDTRGWRALGYIIARIAWLVQVVLVIGEKLKQRIVGSQPNRQTARLRQTIAWIPSRVLHFIIRLIERRKI